MSSSHHKARLAFGLVSIALAAIPLTSAITLAQGPSGYWFDVRSIDTGPLGIANPVGIVFASLSDNLVILDMPKPGQTSTTLVLLRYREEQAAGSKTVAVADPLNLAFDERQKEFWLMERGTSVLSAWPALSDSTLGAQVSKRYDVHAFGLQDVQGMSADPKSGTLYLLDAAGRRIVRVAPDAQGSPNPARAGAVTSIDVSRLGSTQLRGLALNPNNGHLYIMNLNGPQLYELTEAGAFVSTRNLAELKIASPQGMAFGPSADNTDSPATLNLYVADAGRGSVGGRIVELSLIQPNVMAPLAASAMPTLVRTINTSQWLPPSPDPAGIVYWPATGHLLMSDSEVDEIPTLFTGKNLFELSLAGTLLKTYSTISFSNEPTGVTVNTTNGHLFFSKDGSNLITEVDLGSDGEYGTADDTVSSWFATNFGVLDAEDIAYGRGKLFLADGQNAEIWVISPGPDGRFEGPAGDDTATHFDATVLGLRDPEGIAYDPTTGHLWVVSRKSPLVEVTTTGTLVRSFDISFLNTVAPSGITLAPGSNNTSATHIYITDRMVDNSQDPNENDGKTYELAISDNPTVTRTPTSTPTPGGGNHKSFLPFIGKH